MKTIFSLLILFLSLNSSVAQILVQKTNPVSRNFSYLDGNGNVNFKTTFNVKPNSTDSVGVLTVKYRGIVKFLSNRADEEISGSLIKVNSSQSDFVANLQYSNGDIITNKVSGGNIWDNITITVSYKIDGVTYYLPSYIIYSSSAQDAKATHLSVEPRGLVFDNNEGLITVKASGVASVKLTSVTITTTENKVYTTPLNPDLISGSNSNFQVRLKLPDENPTTYKVKVEAVMLDNPITVTPIEKDVTFQRRISLSSIDGNLIPNTGYDLNIYDKKTAIFRINTTGDAGQLDVVCNEGVYKASLKQIAAGIYNLEINSSKVIFDDEESIWFTVDGKRIDQKFTIKRPYPLITISAEQDNENDVKFSVKVPDWITGQITLVLPNGDKLGTTPVTSTEVGYKTFSKDISSKSFKFDSDKDEVLTSAVKVQLEDRILLTAQYKFVNLAFYQKQIQKIQNDKKLSSGTKKTEIEKIVSSVFTKTSGSADNPNVSKISKDLASDTAVKRDSGWKEVAKYAIKYAPAVLSLL